MAVTLGKRSRPMINWDEFEHIHVIRKLREILASWWHTEVFFADDRGQLRGIDREKVRDYRNLVCNLALQTDTGFDSLENYAKKVTEAVQSSEERSVFVDWDLGLGGVAVPINIDNEFMGVVIGVGFYREGQREATIKQLETNLKKMGFSGQGVNEALEKIRVVKAEETNHFVEVVDLVAQEISTLHTEITSREARITELNKELGIRYKYDAMIGKSKPMQDVYGLLDKIKNSESTVMVEGENGTGKELIARAIHYNSARKDRIFVTQNCSAFNENLLDSELFGHMKGSFTGAIKDKKGLFEVADGGTFLLDEIADTSPSMQVKLLRVLQEGTFIPVGATSPKKVDVRILAATNKDLKTMVEKGEFREDLYYRLNVINLRVPALRERKEDIPLLTDHFLEKTAKEKNQKKKQLTKRALEKIFDYNWPGNIRELENEVERLVVLSGDEVKIPVELLSERIRNYGERSKVQGVRVQGKLKDALEELEREMIREGLRRTGWNKSRLAKELGISRAGLIMKVEKYGLDKRKIAKPMVKMG
ncbi:MAG TPA: sigma 54-interacting transcriptional regulator [Bdellovibrionota bacterium]|nr:sigma 54-interacting transcriptional regulator [Bdellovibrionota bacterium]